MRFELRNGTVLENGRAVATISPGVSVDEGARLVGLLNMADRDEQLLDNLAEQITTRNQP